jgi:serine acetyltransferase
MQIKFLFKNISADIKINSAASRNYKIIFFLLLFRLSSFFATNKFFVMRLLGVPIRIIYKCIAEFLYGIELSDKCSIGPGLRIDHGTALIVNPQTVIGAGVTLKNSTTIGNKMCRDGTLGGSPIIEDGVIVGPNVVIFGEVTIGKNSIVGPGSIINKDVPECSIVYGNPMTIKGRY